MTRDGAFLMTAARGMEAGMTPEQALDALWRVASNAVLIAQDDRPAQGMTHADMMVLAQARQTLVAVVEQWRDGLGGDDAERTETT